MSDYYEVHAQEFFDSSVDCDLNSLYAEFLQRLKGKTILDLGCGSGRDSKFFLDAGYTVWPCDYSQELSCLASEHLGIPVTRLDMRKLDYKEEFHGIWACASILHMKKSEIPDILLRCYAALKPRGLMYLSFKYGDSEGVRQGRFFSNYTEISFAELVQVTPFSVEKIWVTEETGKAQEGQKPLQWLNGLLVKGKYSYEACSVAL